MTLRSLFRWMIVTALVAGGIQMAYAAESASPQREAMEMKLDELRQRLALTPEQEAKIAPLIKERNEKLKALRASAGPTSSRREKRNAMQQARSIQQSFIAQVDPLLTSEQKKEWEKIRSEMRDAARERYRNR
jgi:hypothetical protein